MKDRIDIIDTESLRQHSLRVLTENQHPSGAFPAAVDYPVYQYCWFRDGAFVADALSRVGEIEPATRFHLWCSKVIEARRDRVSSLIERAKLGATINGSEMLPTRYTLDGDEGAEPWWDYQLDGYGTWLWAVVHHLDRNRLDPSRFVGAAEVVVSYLATFGDQPCFDWWEEFEQHRHLSTMVSVIAGLEAAAGFVGSAAADTAIEAASRLRRVVKEASDDLGHLPKWVGATTVDASLLSAAVPFGVVEPSSPLAEGTYREIVQNLLVDGVYRYRGDTFYGGGEWIILTAWLGMYEAATGRNELATKRRDWIVAQARPDGDLPEQVATAAQVPDCIIRWEQRWGTVATPLLWSHAMFLTLDSLIQDFDTQ